MKLALGQISVFESVEENLKKAQQMMEEAANKGANVISFPEVSFNRFFPQNQADENAFALAESIPGPQTELLQKKSAELKMVTIFSLFEKDMNEEYYCSAVCIDVDGELLGTTRMAHIYEGENYHEKYYFSPGDTLYPVYKTKYGNIGIALCQDSWYPEVMRALTLRGADVIVVSAAESGEDDSYERYFDLLSTLQGKSASIANGVFVGMANRTGREGDMRFFGSSYVTSPFGSIISKAGKDDDEVLVTDIDLNQIHEARKAFPLLSERRPETFSILTNQQGFHS